MSSHTPLRTMNRRNISSFLSGLSLDSFLWLWWCWTAATSHSARLDAREPPNRLVINGVRSSWIDQDLFVLYVLSFWILELPHFYCLWLNWSNAVCGSHVDWAGFMIKLALCGGGGGTTLIIKPAQARCHGYINVDERIITSSSSRGDW